MILIKHKELLFANREQYIAAVGDTNAACRTFCLQRVTIDGVDLADLSFRLNAELPDGSPDSSFLEKEIRDDEILLTWTIAATMTAQPGTCFINLRAHDDNGTLKWASFKAPVYVEGTTSQPSAGGLSEIEELERHIDQKLNSVDSAEQGRAKAEQEREQAEKDRVAADEERTRKTDEVISTFNENIEQAKKYATAAKSYAVGGTGTRVGENSDNAKEYCRLANIEKGSAEAAAEAARAARDDFIKRLDAGEYTGAQGPKGDKGEKGDSGVSIPGSSLLQIYTDHEDNCAIHCVYDDSLYEAPPIQYREADGAILWQYEDGK